MMVRRLLRLTPALAEIEFVAPAGATLTGQVRGPTCIYAATVAVAYPLRPGPTPNVARVRIPEPNWWTPITPFCYRLATPTQEQEFGLGTGGFTATGFVWNSRPLVLTPTPAETPALAHAAGGNVWLAPPLASATAWLDALRLGMFVVGTWTEAATASEHEQAGNAIGWLRPPTGTPEPAEVRWLELHAGTLRPWPG